MFQDLRGKRVVVTAAATGIGRATARAFLEEGARVHVCDIDEAGLRALAESLPDLGATPADVSDPAAVDHLFDQAEAALGGLDVLINNAGIAGPTGPVEDLSIEDWRRTMAVNLDSQFLCARRAVPLMRAAGGGAMVNIASTAGILGYPLRTPYAASKWAVVGLTKSRAHELGPDGIRVNAICPGSVSGPRMDGVIAAQAEASGRSEEEVREGYARSSALRTFIDPEDIARMALFVCSDAGAKVNGQALAVDGLVDTCAV